MALAYPQTIPTVTGVSSISLYAMHSSAASSSPFTFATQVQSYTGQKWGASVSIPPLPRLQAEQWVSFLLRMKGRFGTFLMGDPNGSQPQGLASGLLRVNGAGQSGDTLSIKGGTSSTPFFFRTGDYIQLGSSGTTRLYKIINNAATGSGGVVEVDIWPNLRLTPSDNDVVTYVNPVGRWRLTDNQTSWDINSASFYGIQFECEEAF